MMTSRDKAPSAAERRQIIRPPPRRIESPAAHVSDAGGVR